MLPRCNLLFPASEYHLESSTGKYLFPSLSKGQQHKAREPEGNLRLFALAFRELFPSYGKHRPLF